jgi:hypothetical protein
MLGNSVAEMATRRHAELDDLAPVTRLVRGDDARIWLICR